MKLLKLLVIATALGLIQACSHPIDIVGDGDVTSASGTRNCTLEDHAAGLANCSKNYVIGAYNETYSATPRPGWLFHRWVNYCSSATNNQCSFNLTAATVGQFWGHKIEGKKPSFLKDVQFLLIGPVWLLHFIYRKVGIGY